MTDRLARSFLFVPGDRPERFDKALASGADAVILDLEDAVAPAAKARARGAVATWLANGGAGSAGVVVRLNAVDTPWHDDDLRMLRGTGAGVVPMLPKADAPALAQLTGALPGRPAIALLETVAGYMGLRELAAARGLSRIAFGSVDFATESGIVDEGEALTAIRTQLVLHCRHAGLPAPIDGVGLEFSDEARMHADALRTRRLGFGAKLCIHPRQLGAVQAAFRPSAAELAWAQQVLAAFEASGGAATALDGKMIDKPVVDRARGLVAESRDGHLDGPA